MSPAKRLAIFDLDGTLFDTLDDLSNAVNTLLARHGFPGHSRDRLRHFVGYGAGVLLQRALPASLCSRSGAFLAEFLEIYHGQPESAALYPGVNELLDALVRARVKLAIATNKPHAATVRLAGKHLTRWSFCAANGHVAGDPLKPDPAVVHRILSSQQLEPSQAVFIGDSETDIETARNAGIDCISVLWGLRTKEELKAAGATRLAFTPADVIPLIV